MVHGALPLPSRRKVQDCQRSLLAKGQRCSVLAARYHDLVWTQVQEAHPHALDFHVEFRLEAIVGVTLTQSQLVAPRWPLLPDDSAS